MHGQLWSLSTKAISVYREDAVKIGYRWTTGAALLSFAVSIAIGMIFHQSPQTKVSAAVGWDPCRMWEQMGAVVRLSALIWFGSFLVLVVKGIRNRSAPRSLSAVGLIAFGVVTKRALWREMNCDTHAGITAFFIWTAAVGVMYLHQLVQSQPKRA
jgi:hypothetical protein